MLQRGQESSTYPIREAGTKGIRERPIRTVSSARERLRPSKKHEPRLKHAQETGAEACGGLVIIFFIMLFSHIFIFIWHITSSDSRQIK